MKPNRLFFFFSFFALLLIMVCLSGCGKPAPPSAAPMSSHEIAKLENDQFLQQKSFDPWILKSTGANYTGAYIGSGDMGKIYDPDRNVAQTVQSGKYFGGSIVHSGSIDALHEAAASGSQNTQELDLQTGTLTTKTSDGRTLDPATGYDARHWNAFWKNSDVEIDGDSEAQQVTHANLFYLTSSLQAGSDTSIPPLGLSSTTYNGRIFWDAEIWMFPALIVQHPDYARTIIDYRYKLLPQAIENAKEHGFKGAEYPWESADDGKEFAPTEFAQERHITADVAYAAWQYYLWTGSTDYLKREGYPVLKANAEYWTSRVTRGPDGMDHIKGVLGPDETGGVVDDDAWTNAVVQYTLRAATRAASVVGQSPDAHWQTVAAKMLIPYDAKLGQYLQFPKMDIARHQAKQADTQMLIYPLDVPMPQAVADKTLDYYIQHTITVGPAMTSSINAIVAARLGRPQQSLDLFHDSYRPFMRAPFDAFSEKRTTNNVYFCTGIGGCLQCVYYGFAGLQVIEQGEVGKGTQVASVGDAALYADPHLPPGWTGLTIKGVQFRGKKLDIAVHARNAVTVTARD